MSGFTFLETILTLSLVAIISATVFPIYSNLQSSTQIKENKNYLIQNLRLAQSQSKSRLNNSGHGIKIQTDSFILYQGENYLNRQANYDRVFLIDSPLILSWNLNGSGEQDEINFSQGFGIPDKNGTILFTNQTDQSQQTISLNSLGKVE